MKKSLLYILAILPLITMTGCSDDEAFNGGILNSSKNNKIYYTSTDGRKVFAGHGCVDAVLLSNTYEDGKGCMTFDETVTEFRYYAFGGKDNLLTIEIPSSVTLIEESAFGGCTSLSGIHIPDSVVSIEEKSFQNCPNLSSFSGKYASEDQRSLIVDSKLIAVAPLGLPEYTIPNNVISIGNYAFSGYENFINIVIPDSVISIGDYAFYNCSSLASITIPESVTSIGRDAFYGCSSLAKVYCKPTTPPTAVDDVGWWWDAFDLNAEGRKIYVPYKSVNAYKSATGWNEYADYIVGYDFE